MPKYTLGKDYNVQENTEHNHAKTWRAYEAVIGESGYITDIEASAICERHENNGYFNYVVKRGWLIEKL